MIYEDKVNLLEINYTFVIMKIYLMTVGKTDVRFVMDGISIYENRLKHYVQFERVELPEIRNTSSLKAEQIKVLEGEMILKRIGKGDVIILLDESGQTYSSMEMAKYLEQKQIAGTKSLWFIIGGAFGFSDEVYRRADGMISLSRMTFPHQLVRVIFLEQLYRAFTIIRGEKYHHP